MWTLFLVASLACSQTFPAVGGDAGLVEVDVLLDSQERWAARLLLSDSEFTATGSTLDATRFVIDLSPARWSGASIRRPGDRGVTELRWANFRGDPPTVRFVVEHRAGWQCSSEKRGLVVEVGCRTSAPFISREVFFELRGLELGSPLEGFGSREILSRSLEYLPKDTVRDGLPHFGAARDDWKGQPRPHQGLDIYADQVPVLAMAAGTVVGAGRGPRSGGWIKLDHGHGVETVYVHVNRIHVREGEKVVRGQSVAEIHGPVGNAIEAQLHLEIRLDGVAVDPAIHFAEAAAPELQRAWKRAIAAIPQRVAERQKNLPPETLR